MCQAVAQKHDSGELVSRGSRDDPHIIMWAGDGFMARKKTKWVQLSAIVISTTSLNQSPNDAKFVPNYRGGKDVDVLLIRLEDLRPSMQRLAREGKLGDTHSELPEGVGGWVEFALGGDTPWLMTAFLFIQIKFKFITTTSLANRVCIFRTSSRCHLERGPCRDG